MIEKLKEGYRKVNYLMRESLYLVFKHKIYALLPLMILLALLGFLFYHSGPAIVVSFIYAGV